ncbi:3-methyl-2-oxobutanoate hydroxymethyltransferase [Anaplasma capra]|uniref:3-methyl-2-oxobutanoate hydroxymethyltransferase n=1 Tax=Anaplasma capra TaxID=1562740 RepID=UPI0021D57729|nr:3-methyl-2-oxobutanoate hydroxymethyltransferase [Anaplasma capra]MCU7611734.1 3-methyl-2-oxobutanoate hydroxymethyltransferase [Anaplasma capra]MCU7612515.1 3-methyl-2-oxobutanoate hydroxymethyltransferase [Anaplasma capra]
MFSITRQESLGILDVQAKKGLEKIACLTAYTFSMARILDEYCDLILVGDSVGATVYGMDSTLPVTMDMMIAHGKAVVKARNKAIVVVDMPFASYYSPEVAYRNASRILSETGCDAVKLEGGVCAANEIAFLVSRGIPVMGHIGVMPQHFNQLGGYKCRGKTEDSRRLIEQDAKAVCEAGAFCVVMECISAALAAEITKKLPVPTIGIGASGACDGQILVVDDMLGQSPRYPKFVKQFANLEQAIRDAVVGYVAEVKCGKFPSTEHCYK